MPDADAIRATIEQYLARFSAGDREGWLDLWADGATMEDPVGSPIRTGRQVIGAFYDQGPPPPTRSSCWRPVRLSSSGQRPPSRSRCARPWAG